MRPNTLETLSGFGVLLIAIGFSYFMYGFYQPHTVANRCELKACFDRVDGILEGSDVRLSGVKIGRVQSIHIDSQTYQAVLILSLDGTLSIPKDSSAEIVSEGLMGGKYVNLTPGSSDQFLVSGNQIDRTQSSISIENLIGKYVFGSQNGTASPHASAQ
jgi:phospholipid/cholesterol/gamma-HCH transport system substrate-binding protein